MKVKQRNVLGFVAVTLLSMSGCSDSSLSDNDVRECILNATGHNDIGVELEESAMGIAFQTTIINEIVVENIIPKGDVESIAQVSIEFGQKQKNVPEKAARETANMFGWKYENGFIIQDVKTSYVFMKGSKGWSCQELQ